MDEPIIKEEVIADICEYIQDEFNRDQILYDSSSINDEINPDEIKTEEADDVSSTVKDKEGTDSDSLHSGVNQESNRTFTKFILTYRCHSCKSARKMKESYSVHEKDCTRNIKMYKCLCCDYLSEIVTNLKYHYYRKHDMTYREKSLFCYHCNYKTNFRSNLSEHIKRNHWIKYEEFSCDKCPYKTKLREYLTKHMQRQHGNEQENMSYSCKQCDYKSKYNHHLLQHIQVKHLNMLPYECKLCQFKTKCKQYLQKHMKRTHEEPSVCPHCSFVAKCADYMNEHMKNKHIEHWQRKRQPVKKEKKPKYTKSLKCPHCKFVTKYPADIKQHIKTQHDSNCELHKCELCQFTSKHKQNVYKHYRNKHQIDISKAARRGFLYTCVHCKYETKFKDLMTSHFVGNDKDALKCGECKLKTNCESYLKYHKNLINHHKESNKNNGIKCDYCAYRTSNMSYLQKHLNRKHKDKLKNFRCIHCNLQTKTKKTLNTHFQCKENAKGALTCRDCSFVTKCQNYMKLHIENNHIKTEIEIQENSLCPNPIKIEATETSTVDVTVVKNEPIDDVSNLRDMGSSSSVMLDTVPNNVSVVKNENHENDENESFLNIDNLRHSIPINMSIIKHEFL